MAMKYVKPLDYGTADKKKDEVPVNTGDVSQPSTQTNTQNTSTSARSTASTTPAKTTTGFVPSADVLQAQNLLQQWQTSRPGSYTPVWQDEADAYLSQYQNRGPFSYDFNADALYQQYKDNYIQQGQMAMMDTMGQAAAMTGGYGNSYAQNVGQQAYNQYLGQLNAVMPELYQMAHDRYTLEGQEMLNMYDLYMNREAQEYGRYQDNLANWYQEVARLQSDYDSQYAKEYTKYRDDVADQQWQKSFNRSSSSYTGKNDDEGDGDFTPTYELTENAQALLDRIPFTKLDKNSAAWKDAKNQQMLKAELNGALEKGWISEEELAAIIYQLQLDTIQRGNN